MIGLCFEVVWRYSIFAIGVDGKPPTFTWFSLKENHTSLLLPDHSNCENALNSTFHDDIPASESSGFDRGVIRLDQLALATASHHDRHDAAYSRLRIRPHGRGRLRAWSACMGGQPGAANRLREPDSARHAGAVAICRSFFAGPGAVRAGEARRLRSR